MLMLDEPTAGLDPRTDRLLLERLHGVGKTIVVATHQLDVLEHIGDRAVVLDEDHTVASAGPVADVLADRDLLLRVNLVPEHAHVHGGMAHTHVHDTRVRASTSTRARPLPTPVNGSPRTADTLGVLAARGLRAGLQPCQTACRLISTTRKHRPRAPTT